LFCHCLRLFFFLNESNQTGVTRMQVVLKSILSPKETKISASHKKSCIHFDLIKNDIERSSEIYHAFLPTIMPGWNKSLQILHCSSIQQKLRKFSYAAKLFFPTSMSGYNFTLLFTEFSPIDYLLYTQVISIKQYLLSEPLLLYRSVQKISSYSLNSYRMRLRCTTIKKQDP